MLTAHPRLRPASEYLGGISHTPIWIPDPSEVSGDMEVGQRARKQKEKRLTYNGPPIRKRLPTTTDFISSTVRRPPHVEVQTKKKDIDRQLLPGTDFNFLKFRPRYKRMRQLSAHPNQYPLQLEPFAHFAFANGDKYDGQFAIDPDSGPQRFGIGKYVKSNGSVFMGDWFADKLSGPKCAVILPMEKIKYRGEMKDGKFHGYGVYRGTDGFYQGQFKNGRLVGKSLLIDGEGFSWTGNFRCSSALGLELDLEIVRHDSPQQSEHLKNA